MRKPTEMETDQNFNTFPDPLRTNTNHGLTAHTLVSNNNNNNDNNSNFILNNSNNHSRSEMVRASCDHTSRFLPNRSFNNSPIPESAAVVVGIEGKSSSNSGNALPTQNSLGASRAISSLAGGSSRGAVGVLVMVYGSAEVCSRTQCGLTYMPYKPNTLRNTSNNNSNTSNNSQQSSNSQVNLLSNDQIHRMDTDGTLDISFDEWRDYLLFHPSANLHDIILYWRHATNLDVGEDLSVPDDFSLEEWLSGKWWRHLVAGGFAGMVSRTCTAPLDRLKVFLQVHGAKQFMGLRHCFSYMLNEGGVKSLWRGNGINVLKIAPESALKFAAYEQAKRVVLQFGGSRERELSIYERFVAGSFAGGFSQTVIYPLEVLKTRLALRKTGQYKSIIDAAKKIYHQEGLRSFYRGYVPNLLGIIPYAGIDLAIYETLKKAYIDHHSEVANPSIFVIIACGAFSSSCGQLASYPLALVRTKLQAQVVMPGVVQAHPITMSGLFRHILATEGMVGLYRGITPNFMKVAPAVSISYVVYEKCRQALGVTMT